MKIAYICQFQSEGLRNQRHLVRNRNLGPTQKVQSIASGLQQRGHDVRILARGTPAERTGRWYRRLEEKITDGDVSLPVTSMPAIDLPLLNVWSGVPAALSWLSANQPWDVAIVYNLGMTEIVIANYLARADVPIVFEYEDEVSSTPTGGRGQLMGGRLRMRSAQKLARGVFAVSSDLERQFGHDNSLVVPGVVPDRLFDEKAKAVRSSGGTLRVLYAGGLTEGKGLLILIEAWRSIGSELSLTIVGEGPLREAVQRAADTTTNITFLGEVTRARLEEELRIADICVNPHLTAQGQQADCFPFKVMEYLAAGCVLVSSPLGCTDLPLSKVVRFFAGDDPAALRMALLDVAEHFTEWKRNSGELREILRGEISSLAVAERLERILLEGVRRGSQKIEA